MTPFALMVTCDGVEVRTYQVHDPSDLGRQLLAANELCSILMSEVVDLPRVVAIVPLFVMLEAPADPAPTWTMVLINRPPTEAEDGDFIAVEGVTVADLSNPDSLAWLQRMAEAMAEGVAADATR